ncbi:MAG: hypothetical protein HY654_12785, partial [Acidobacteria bacterium]|nr:hypothetical protein [Acidobacteriota bacterium]
YDDVQREIDATADWTSRTDRDLRPRNRPGRRYYQFARRWMTAEVARDRHAGNGKRWLAAKSAVSAQIGSLGMWLFERTRTTRASFTPEPRTPNPESRPT